MLADQIIHSIGEGKIGPFYFLYGAESFYRLEIIRADRQFFAQVVQTEFLVTGDQFFQPPFILAMFLVEHLHQLIISHV